MHRFIILIGSNLLNPDRVIDARKRLMAFLGNDLHFSAIHQSQAVSNRLEKQAVEKMNDYFNVVCTGQTTFSFEQVNNWLKKTELDLGRKRGLEAKGLVAIDLDLVEWDNRVIRPQDASQPYYLTCLADL
jgi:2-amino-4-hydroxy-6-hydroxymethyldihydropteridine diphosphokinase